AAELLFQARAIYADLGDRSKEASILQREGRRSPGGRKLQKARSDLEFDLERSSKIEDGARVAEACAGLGKISIAEGESDRALDYFERGLAAYPESVECRLGRIRVLTLEDRHVDALEEIERVLNIDPKNAIALAFRGNIAREQGAYGAAID